MSLFFKQNCLICNKKISSKDNTFSTSHFIEDENHELYDFSDQTFHLHCFMKWKNRIQFSNLYFEIAKTKLNPPWEIVYCDEKLLLTVNPDDDIQAIEILLADTATSFRLSTDAWQQWTKSGWRKSARNEIEYEILKDNIERLALEFSNEKLLRQMATSKDKNTKKPMPILEYEVLCYRLAQKAASEGISCPHCGTFSKQYNYFQPEAIVSTVENGSYLICNECKNTFGPLDV